jgi:hypothetical protein
MPLLPIRDTQEGLAKFHSGVSLTLRIAWRAVLTEKNFFVVLG